MLADSACLIHGGLCFLPLAHLIDGLIDWIILFSHRLLMPISLAVVLAKSPDHSSFRCCAGCNQMPADAPFRCSHALLVHWASHTFVFGFSVPLLFATLV